MCKIAGFFSQTEQTPDLLRPLLRSPKSLKRLAKTEPHGHGIAYVDLRTGEQKTFKGMNSAEFDPAFVQSVKEANGNARALSAHIRYATQGLPALENTHPFTWGDVSLVMNGSLPNFQKHKEEILKFINPEFRPHIKGHTDSECVLFLYLSMLNAVARNAEHPTAEEGAKALSQCMELLCHITNRGADFPAGINVIILSPELMLSSRLNRELSFSDSFGPKRSDTKLTEGAKVGGLAVATHPWKGNLGWTEVPNGSVMGIDLDSPLFFRPAGGDKGLPLGPIGPRSPRPEVPQ